MMDAIGLTATVITRFHAFKSMQLRDILAKALHSPTYKNGVFRGLVDDGTSPYTTLALLNPSSTLLDAEKQDIIRPLSRAWREMKGHHPIDIEDLPQDAAVRNVPRRWKRFMEYVGGDFKKMDLTERVARSCWYGSVEQGEREAWRVSEWGR